MYGHIFLKSFDSTTGTPALLNDSNALARAGLNPINEDSPIFMERSVLESPIEIISLVSKSLILASFSTISPF